MKKGIKGMNMIDFNKLDICLCADDYALTPAVSRGIRELLAKGKLLATSAMTLTSHWASECKKFKELEKNNNAKYYLGIHLTLTDHVPLTGMPKLCRHSSNNSIVQSSFNLNSKSNSESSLNLSKSSDSTCTSGKMPNINTLIKLSYLNQLPLDEIEQELRAQFENFKKEYGELPSHIDGHQHVHILPGVRDILIKLYLEYYGQSLGLNGDKVNKLKAPIRSCCNSIVNILFKIKADFKVKLKTLIIHLLSKGIYKKLKSNSIPTNYYFFGVYDFDLENKSYKNVFTNFINIIKATSIKRDDSMLFAETTRNYSKACKNLIMCHPGYVDKELEEIDSVTVSREKELKFFLNESW